MEQIVSFKDSMQVSGCIICSQECGIYLQIKTQASVVNHNAGLSNLDRGITHAQVQLGLSANP